MQGHLGLFTHSPWKEPKGGSRRQEDQRGELGEIAPSSLSALISILTSSEKASPERVHRDRSRLANLSVSDAEQKATPERVHRDRSRIANLSAQMVYFLLGDPRASSPRSLQGRYRLRSSFCISFLASPERPHQDRPKLAPCLEFEVS